jgi:site-specific recombinase XerD
MVGTPQTWPPPRREGQAFLFRSKQTGKRMTSVHASWFRLRIKAQLPTLRLHDLRHQYASMLVNSGRSLFEFQRILGHSDPSVTQRYSHLSTRTLQEAAESTSARLEAALALAS